MLPTFFLFLILAYYLSGYLIERRPEREQDSCPQVRILAKTRDWLREKTGNEEVAAFLTEAFSGLLHAAAAWGLLVQIEGVSLCWAWIGGALMLMLWIGIGVGQAIAVDRQLRRLKKEGTAVEVFLANPVPCLLPHSQAAGSVWREDGCENMYVVSRDVSIGYVHNIRVDRVAGVVTIGHFAVERGLERRGVGRRLAQAIRAEFAFRFKVNEIRFAENSSKYATAGYAPFFQSLGAVPVNDPQSTRPVWHWKV